MNNKKRWITLVVLLMSQIVMTMGAYVWGPIAPYLKESLSLTPVQIGSISSSLYFIAILFSIPSGMSVDRFGVQKNLILCTALMGGSLIFLGLFGSDFISLVLFASISGIGYGMIYPVSSKALLAWFDREVRATAFGIRQSGVTIGAALTGILSVYIAQRSNYQTTFLVMGGLNLFMAIIASNLHLEQTLEDAGLHNKIFTLNKLKHLVKDKNLVSLSLIMAFFCFSQSSIISFFILYLKEYLAYSIEIAGLLFALMMATGSLARIFWGITSDKVFKTKRRPVLLLICSIALISTIFVSFISYNPPFLLLSLVVTSMGASFFGSQGLTIAYIAEISKPTLVGTSTSMAIAIAWLGMVFGPICFGTAVLHFGYPIGWILLSFLSLLSLVTCFFLE